MSQKSSLPQAAKSVSQVLMSDTGMRKREVVVDTFNVVDTLVKLDLS